MKPTKPMNRRSFLRKAWVVGAGMALLSRLPKGPDSAAGFLLDEMTKGARREASMPLDNAGLTFWLNNSETGERIPLDGSRRPISWDETDAARAERFAQQMRAICDAIQPSIDAIAEPRECVIPKSGRVWYVGPHGNDANDGLAPESCVQTLEAGLILAGRGDEVGAA